MQKCSICEKPIYGHPQAKANEKIVCGSCPLNKLQGGPSGKSLFQIRIDLAKLVTKQLPENQENLRSDMKVKSNVRNRTILLDGRIPVVFDDKGFAQVPAHLRELLEREMVMKPGRFSVVEKAQTVSVPVVTPVEVVPEVPVKVEEKTPIKVEEVPLVIDQSFLEKTPPKSAKKTKKK